MADWTVGFRYLSAERGLNLVEQRLPSHCSTEALTGFVNSQESTRFNPHGRANSDKPGKP